MGPRGPRDWERLALQESRAATAHPEHPELQALTGLPGRLGSGQAVPLELTEHLVHLEQQESKGQVVLELLELRGRLGLKASKGLADPQDIPEVYPIFLTFPTQMLILA